MDPDHNVIRLSLYERTTALFLLMRKLIGPSSWEKEGTADSGESMEQWRAGVDADLKQLNQKMDLYLQFFGILAPLVIPQPTNPTEDSGKKPGGFPDLPYILL